MGFSKIKKELGIVSKKNIKDTVKEISGAISNGIISNIEDCKYHNYTFLNNLLTNSSN